MTPLLLFNSTNPKICLLWEAIQVAAKVSQSIAQHIVAAHNTTSPTSQRSSSLHPLSLPWPYHLEEMCQQSRGSVQHQTGSHRQTEAQCGAARVSSPSRVGRSALPAVHWPPATGRARDLSPALPGALSAQCPAGIAIHAPAPQFTTQGSGPGRAHGSEFQLTLLLAVGARFLPETRLLRIRRNDCRSDFLRDFTRDSGPSMAKESLG